MNYPTTTPLRVEAWPDPVIDRLGHAPNSSYFEWLWVPRIGPSELAPRVRTCSPAGAQTHSPPNRSPNRRGIMTWTTGGCRAEV